MESKMLKLLFLWVLMLMLIWMCVGETVSSTSIDKHMNYKAGGRPILMIAPVFKGHLLPMIELGKQLLDEGYRVVFTIFEFRGDSSRKMILESGFELFSLGAVNFSVPEMNSNSSILEVFASFGDFIKSELEVGFVSFKKTFQQAKSAGLDHTQCMICNPLAVIYESMTVYGLDIAHLSNAPALNLITTFVFPVRVDQEEIWHPSLFLPTDSKRFLNRLKNYFGHWFQLSWLSIFHYQLNTARAKIGLPPLYQQKKNAQDYRHLILSVAGFPIEFQRSLPQLIQVVGPLIHLPSTYDKNALSDSLRLWLDTCAENGIPVIFVSMGSVWIPERERVIELAKGLIARVPNNNRSRNEKEGPSWAVLWARGKPLFGSISLTLDDLSPPNMNRSFFLLENFVPQKAILAHKAVKVFVSHCGMGSTQESLFFGVPMIAIPQIMDQIMIAQRITEWGVGLELDEEFSAQELETAISSILNDPKFFRNAGRVQIMLKANGGVERAVKLIELMIEMGDATFFLPYPIANNFTWLERTYYDVKLLFVAIIGAALLGIFFCCRWCCCSLWRKRKMKQQ